MNEEMRAEAIEISITACEKYAPNYEVLFQLYIPTDNDVLTFRKMFIGSGKNN